MFGSWSVENNPNSANFEANVYDAIVAGQKCAIARKDKQAIKRFEAIVKTVGKGNGDCRDRLTSQDQSFIRLWYLRSLEN